MPVCVRLSWRLVQAQSVPMMLIMGMGMAYSIGDLMFMFVIFGQMQTDAERDQ